MYICIYVYIYISIYIYWERERGREAHRRHVSSMALQAEVSRTASATRCFTAGVGSPSAHLLPWSFCCACAKKGSSARLYLKKNKKHEE